MRISLLPQTFAICRLPASSAIPDWAQKSSFFSASRSSEELSIVCEQAGLPENAKAEKDWRTLKVEGTLDFALTGILASIANPLAEAEISIFAVSTFDTDYFLVKESTLPQACAVLRKAGFLVS